MTVERRRPSDDDALVAGTGCTPAPSTVRLRRRDQRGDRRRRHGDRITAGYVDDDADAFFGLTTIPATINGGDGNDALAGGARGDTIDGGAGNDDIDGFAGNDRCAAATATTTSRRTPAPTRWSAATASTPPPTASASRRASRSTASPTTATAGENDLIGTDVENIEGAADDAAQTVTITGDGRANRLTVTAGKGDHHRRRRRRRPRGRPAGRPDQRARRLARHRHLQRRHRHRARRHARHVSPSCENVQIQATPGGAVRRPPADARLGGPGAGASLTRQRADELSVNATDDRGLTQASSSSTTTACCARSPPRRSLRLPAARRRRRPQHADRGRHRRRRPDDERRARGHRPPLRPKALGAHAQARAATARRRTPSASPASSRARRRSRPRRAARARSRFSAKRGTKTISTKRVSLSRTCEYKTTFTLQDAAAPAACASRRSSAATRSLSTVVVEDPHRPPGLAFQRRCKSEGERPRRRRRVGPRRRHRPPRCTRPAPTSRSPISTPSAAPRSPRRSARASSRPTSPTRGRGRGRGQGRRGRRRPADLHLLRRHRPGREDRRPQGPAQLRAVRDA